MNKLQIALQGFESLSPSLNVALDEDVSDRAESWLTTEVCPVVEELTLSLVGLSTPLRSTFENS